MPFEYGKCFHSSTAFVDDSDRLKYIFKSTKTKTATKCFRSNALAIGAATAQSLGLELENLHLHSAWNRKIKFIAGVTEQLRTFSTTQIPSLQ